MDKYNEALEKAKLGLPIDEIFPELKESENDRIRKEIISFIKEFEKDHYRCIDFGSWIAYLEKQKEQKPLMYDGEIEDTKRDIVAAIRKYYPADYAEYLTSFLKGLSPEDNSDDEYGQEMLGIAYKLMYEHIPENLRTQEFWDSLKFMREYTGKVAIIHSYEKPAEWGEEEQQTISFAIDWLIKMLERTNVPEAKLDIESVIMGLKSLRPQPHWKPGKKQMEALEDAFRKDGGNEYRKVINSLYCDLQKLL